MAHASSFGITTAREFFQEIVIPHYGDFKSDNASPRHALSTTIFAYHMYEWVNTSKFTIADFTSKYPNDSELATVFDLARNITNGTKHFIPKAETRTQSGFSSAFSSGFARPLIVKFPNGSETSADEFLEKMIAFWQRQADSGAF